MTHTDSVNLANQLSFVKKGRLLRMGYLSLSLSADGHWALEYNMLMDNMK